MEASSVTFAGVSDADFEFLADLRVAAMRESLERVGRFDPIRARDRLWANFEPAHTRFIRVENETVGFYAMRPSPSGLSLEHFYIHPHFQNRGIGSTALKKILTDADKRGMSIGVGALKESASNRFYQRHGFVRQFESEWDIYYVRAPSAGNPK